MNKNAYITLLSTNNYLYGCIGLMYSGKLTNSKYPFYCVVTEDITEANIKILEAIGYKIIKDSRYIPNSYFETIKRYEESGNYETPIGESTSDLTKNGGQYGGTKLQIFKYTQFDKLLYIDADSYIFQNLDELFEYPNGSSICELDAVWSGLIRFHSAFFLIEPNKKVYEEIINLAEANPIIKHPSTNEYQLSNDYDLLNLYKSDGAIHQECMFPNYAYVDSYALNTSDRQFPFLINSFMKIKAIHLTGTKPWLAGTSEVENYSGEWGLGRELYLMYIKFLNKALEDIGARGIAILPIVK